jgi:glycosyltransferase involved in cell wall biosynthesis
MLGYAKELGVEKAVKYLGVKKLEEIVEEIDRSDVGIIPNRHSVFTEINMPTRIFEYLSRGKPVIAPGTTGIRDYFAEDELFFFEAGSSESLAAQLQNVYVLGPKAGETVKRGQSVYQEHQWEDERSRLIEIAAKLVE